MMEQKYRELCEILDISEGKNYSELNYLIKEVLIDFMKDKQQPAIYCNGIHTSRLMADYVYELKKVKYIIDQNESSIAEGYNVISKGQIDENGIDAVIISSFKFRKQIGIELKNSFPHVRVLDIYEELEMRGIILKCEYYKINHPYSHYQEINSINLKIENGSATTEDKKRLLSEYIKIKDFKNAKMCLEKLQNCLELDISLQVSSLLSEIEALKLEYARRIASQNVVMLCCDGLRREDVCENKMPIINKWMTEKTHFFDNAFSYSTSTFESLMPVYSGNIDLSSDDYTKNVVNENECAFLQVAISQNREIYFYTDSDHMIESDNVHYVGETQTVTQKIWNFLCDAININNGLFYIHELYETHFSFPSPYVESDIVAEGTNILFDFLPHNGGVIRTDYEKQQLQAVKYVDEMLGPILNELKCKVILFADHGNLVLNNKTTLEKINDEDLLASNTLTHIPLAIYDGNDVNNDMTLLSLYDLPSFIINLLNDEKINISKKEYIKIARNELYNPNFKSIYSMKAREEYRQAFEKFVFANGEYIYLFADGNVMCSTDSVCEELLSKVRVDITVLFDNQDIIVDDNRR